MQLTLLGSNTGNTFGMMEQVSLLVTYWGMHMIRTMSANRCKHSHQPWHDKRARMLLQCNYHGIVWVARDLHCHLFPILLLRQGHSSNLPVNTSGDGAFATFLDNLFWCLTTLMMKIFFPISNLNTSSACLKVFPLVLSLHSLVKSSFSVSGLPVGPL